MNCNKNKLSIVFFSVLIFTTFFSAKNLNAQCGSCTNPTGIVSVGSGQSICYDVNTTITTLQAFFDGVVTICDGVTLTITGTSQLSGTAQIIMNNCSEVYQIGSFTCASNNAFVYAGDSTCDARFTIESSSTLCASLTTNSNIQFCNLNNSSTTGSPGAATIGCGLPLPIGLIDFNTTIQNENKILIEWSTAFENNNDFFTIEHSLDAIQWEDVMSINGARSSNQTLNYSALDYTPYFGVSYYRLKQTDFDGQFSHSNIVSVNLEENKSSIFIYPNPTNGIFTIQGNKNELSELRIFNILGQEVTSSILIKNYSSTVKTVNLKTIPKGVYTVKTKTSTNTLFKR